MTSGGEGSSGVIVSEETRKKKSAKMKGRKITWIDKIVKSRKNYKHSKETIEKILNTKRINGTMNSNKNRKPMTDETKLKISKASKGRKLTPESIQKILNTKRINGTFGNHKGYKHTQEHKERMSKIMKGRKITWGDKISEIKSKEYIMINPKGEIIKIKNMNKFCRENNLNSGNMFSVIKGIRKYHRGWTAYNNN